MTTESVRMGEIFENLQSRCPNDLWHQIRRMLIDCIKDRPSKLAAVKTGLFIGDKAFGFNEGWLHLETLKVWHDNKTLLELTLLVDDERNSIIACQSWDQPQSVTESTTD